MEFVIMNGIDTVDDDDDDDVKGSTKPPTSETGPREAEAEVAEEEAAAAAEAEAEAEEGVSTTSTTSASTGLSLPPALAVTLALVAALAPEAFEVTDEDDLTGILKSSSSASIPMPLLPLRRILSYRASCSARWARRCACSHSSHSLGDDEQK